MYRCESRNIFWSVAFALSPLFFLGCCFLLLLTFLLPGGPKNCCCCCPRSTLEAAAQCCYTYANLFLARGLWQTAVKTTASLSECYEFQEFVTTISEIFAGFVVKTQVIQFTRISLWEFQHNRIKKKEIPKSKDADFQFKPSKPAFFSSEN